MFNYKGPVNSTGYGVASASILEELINLDPNVDLHEQVISLQTGGMDDGYFHNVYPNIHILNKGINTLPLKNNHNSFVFWHLGHADTFIGAGKNVLYTTFETDGFAPTEVSSFSKFDQFATASDWGVEILKRNTDKPVHKIPHAFLFAHGRRPFNVKVQDPIAFWRPILKSWVRSPETFDAEKFVVLSHCGKFEQRKGTPELLAAVERLSNEVIPVALIVSSHNHWNPTALSSYLLHRNFRIVSSIDAFNIWKKKNCYIIQLPFKGSREAMYHYLCQSHLYVSPSKGEGWDLPLFDMLSLGATCVFSNVAAHTEYSKGYNPNFLIECDELVVAKDGHFFNGSKGNWYNITTEMVFDSLIRAIKHAAEPTGFNYNITWQNVASDVVKIMTSL